MSQSVNHDNNLEMDEIYKVYHELGITETRNVDLTRWQPLDHPIIRRDISSHENTIQLSYGSTPLQLIR